MNKQKKAAPTGSEFTPLTKTNIAENKRPYKVELALNSILHNGPRGITQPEAFSSYRESCLHTTISSLRHDKNIDFISLPDLETVAHFHQKPFNRYWLATDSDRVKALRLLNFYRSNRGLEKVKYEAWHSTSDKAA
ncbi:hypothetical protein [Alteromonas naphthalenivorans]|jgi:hypothetical protein|uniref:Uncharacterized protein n=1 Tax=Alteromonas naphthalenivorans TaxID=715451 RepID=F5ZCU8_ALTNA|nr:hypothetical protein [Alteromonas naphthalenivorans]AEF03710.1 hypothetical protein ambt_10940 [Alteromonas naphthalenivorans]